MAFQRPTLIEIITRVLADLSSRMLGIDGAVLRRSVLGVLGRALSGASHELHGHLDYLARQVIIDTADTDYLERWASVWGVSRKAAEYAIGEVTFTGVNGSVIPEATVLQRQDGVRFETTAEGTISAGTADVAVQAQEAGAAGNTIAAVALTLIQPVSGVQSTAVVAAGDLTNGSDTETDDELRERLLDRIQDPPQGGAAADYVTWALEVPGVTRAWCYPMEMGAGTVTVRFVRDNDGSIIPDAPEIAAVLAYIQERRPVTAEVFVVAPTPVEVDMTIQLEPNTTAVQNAVLAELADLFNRQAEPGGTILYSHIHEAISVAPGETDHGLVDPTDNIELDPGEIAVLGTVTFEAIP